MTTLREYIRLIENVEIDEVTTERNYPPRENHTVTIYKKDDHRFMDESNGYFYYSVQNQYFVLDKKLEDIIKSSDENKDYLDVSKNNGLVGYLFINVNGNEIYDVYIFPEYRGKGIAKKLYDCAIIKDNRILKSSNQTEQSQNLWKYFISHPAIYYVWLEDRYNGEKISDMTDPNFVRMAYSRETDFKTQICVKKRG
jgi:GNAT superfamily N-acetyltransferase